MTPTLPALPAATAPSDAPMPRDGLPAMPPQADTLRLGGLSPLFADPGRLRIGGLSPLFGR